MLQLVTKVQFDIIVRKVMNFEPPIVRKCIHQNLVWRTRDIKFQAVGCCIALTAKQFDQISAVLINALFIFIEAIDEETKK